MATNQPNAASTSTENVMTLYACGKALPAGMLGDKLSSMALDHVKKTMPNLVPTTYEAADAYLREERKKPEGARNLLQEMCVIIPIGLPKDRKVSIVLEAMKVIIPLTDGSMMVVPTTDVPPNSFGTPENWGFLDSEMLVYDPPTHVPQKGIIVLSYLTKLGPDVPMDSSVDAIKLDTLPHA